MKQTVIIIIALILVGCGTTRRAMKVEESQQIAANYLDSMMRVQSAQINLITTQMFQMSDKLSSWYTGTTNTTITDYDTTGRPIRSTVQTSETRGGSERQSQQQSQTTLQLTANTVDSIVAKRLESLRQELQREEQTTEKAGLPWYQRVLITVGFAAIMVVIGMLSWWIGKFLWRIKP